MIVYAQPYLCNKKIIKPRINIQSANELDYYASYYYCAAYVSTKPLLYEIDRIHSKPSTDENLTRLRRTVQFSDTTKLRPEKREYSDESLIARAIAARSNDHVSSWRGLGIDFILNEPYRVDSTYMSELDKQGLVSIVVPANLSPYCGSWDPAVGATPRTTSYLICDKAHVLKLVKIGNLLKAELPNAPEWNDTAKVRHV